ncbi:MAG: hypothetical protein QXX64_03195 [Nitrososphaera sp.]|uniref:Uncharacterized protein n=1 Tax=Nitrososphaera gargensis (strain Ga9.2) TaxID=1237085 RepID=K0ILM1_NITGG|nr:hypothetical protein [Candidatus Nitrososphaera gargensis]AFU59557.1 hypothetical protein Ngar_c26350 [Candidatus Nitrososphaera gargensis Ga9.2]
MVGAQVKDEKSTIAIFDTFKTRKNKFTGEAKRQRGIIAHLATEQSPELRTRTSIAHAIAKQHGILWQNIYSGIFRDLDEVLIPAGVVKEGGRLPLRRGPKALQLEGVPFYELTDAGMLVASAIEELGDKRMKLLQSYISSLPAGDTNSRTMKEGMLFLIVAAPSFISKIISEYIYAYSTGAIDTIAPLDAKKLRSVIAKQITVEKELVEAFVTMQQDHKDLVRNFFKVLT